MLAVAIWSISMISMGILHENDCPYANHYGLLESLQSCLIVLGAFFLGLILIPFVVTFRKCVQK